MDAVTVAHHMQQIISALSVEGKLGKELLDAKADALIAYRKQRAVRALFHKSNGMAVTLIKHQADGDAAVLEGEMVRTADAFKIHIIRMDNLRSQLNGYQSINRHLAVV